MASNPALQSMDSQAPTTSPTNGGSVSRSEDYYVTAAEAQRGAANEGTTPEEGKEQQPSANVGEMWGGLILFCIETDFCNQIFIFQHFSRSTR